MIIIISMQFTYIRTYICIWGELAASLHIKGAQPREIRHRVFLHNPNLYGWMTKELHKQIKI